MAIAVINPTTGATERTLEPHDADEIERRVALLATRMSPRTSPRTGPEHHHPEESA